MNPERYRYHFRSDLSFDDVEDSLDLSVLALESIHGESQVRLDATHAVDPGARQVVIDVSTPVGRDLARLFTGFLLRGLGEDCFRVQRIARQDADCVVPL